MGCGSSSDAGDQLRAQQEQQQALTNQSVANINSAFAGFTPQFYSGVEKAYQNWAVPQLQQQYQQNQNQLGFKLARQGLTDSSQAQGLYNQLGQAQNQAQQQIAQNALQQSQNLQSQVAQEKSNLIGQAQTATSPSSIGQQATEAASQFAAPSAFQPFGNLFGTFANNYLANQLQNTYNPASIALLTNPYLYGSFGARGNSYMPPTGGF